MVVDGTNVIVYVLETTIPRNVTDYIKDIKVFLLSPLTAS